MFWHNAYAGTIALPQASTIAAAVDHISDDIFILSFVFTALITVALAWFVWKYSHNRGVKAEQISTHHGFERAATVFTFVLMLWVFWIGYKGYVIMRKDNPAALEVNVLGRQWLWQFQYVNGRTTLNDLYVPLGKPVRLIMTSDDVIHSFYMPNQRIKQDVVPGMYTRITFEPTVLGEHHIFCAEFCGTSHSDMVGRVIVLPPAQFDFWYKNGKLPPGVQLTSNIPHLGGASGVAKTSSGAVTSLAEKGQVIYNTKGCNACHTVDGASRVGPTFKGAFGKTEEMQDGKTVTVDENYIRESLVDPQAKVVKGFAPTMPTFKGQLSEEEITALIAFIKSLK